jgi:hypothetical protein
VVTAGAPDLRGGSLTRNLPAIFTWGESGGLQFLVLPEQVSPLVDRDYNNFKGFVLIDAGLELTPYVIESAIDLVSR